MQSYGKELILDLFDCDIDKFTRKNIKKYLIELCDILDMQREDLHWWDYEGDAEGYEKAPDHLKGISCIQFIRTSNITIHTIDAHRMILLNIFSCKDYNFKNVIKFTIKSFNGSRYNSTEIMRG